MPQGWVDTAAGLWTYGCEHELADWDTSRGLPAGFGRSDDWTLVNTNTVAVQPNPADYRFGGEVNTPPTTTPEGQVVHLGEVLRLHPDAAVNYRSNLHVHVRVPGLCGSLTRLKSLQQYIHDQLPKVIDMIEPIPAGTCPGSRKRARRRRVSHHTFLTPTRLSKQLAADTLKGFFEAEVPRSKSGVVMWHAQPRVCVNLRQLLQTDTVEFRHFPGTLNPDQLLAAVCWCRDFLLAAFGNRPIAPMADRYAPLLPTFPAYDLEQEIGYQATAAHNGLGREEINQNIEAILSGRFYGSVSYDRAKERACGLPRKRV